MTQQQKCSADIADPDFVQSVEVQTEYEKGWAAGQAALQSTCELAFQQALANELEIEALQARVKELRMQLSGDVAQSSQVTDAMVNAAAREMWNDRDARMGGPWEGRSPDEVCVVQTKATARAALEAALVAQPPAAPVETDQGIGNIAKDCREAAEVWRTKISRDASPETVALVYERIAQSLEVLAVQRSSAGNEDAEEIATAIGEAKSRGLPASVVILQKFDVRRRA